MLRGFNKQRHLKFLDILKESSKEILITNRLEGRIFEEQNEEVVKFFERGGVIKSIYEVSTNFKIKIDDKWVNTDKRGLVDLCESFEKQGVQIRLVNEMPQNFTIFDGTTVFLNLVDETVTLYNRSDIIISNERYANSMIDLFSYYWENSMTIHEFKQTL